MGGGNKSQGYECDSKRIKLIRFYEPKLSLSSNNAKQGRRRIKAFHFAFLMAYVYQAYWVASTIGLPYKQFLEKAEREGFEVMEGATRMRAELLHSIEDIHDETRPADKIGWFDWMQMDIEEHASRKKREREQTVLDAIPRKMRVPNRYAPSFWSMLGTGMILVSHVFLALLQVWLVGFNVWLNYYPVSGEDMDIPDDEEYEEIMEKMMGGGGGSTNTNGTTGTMAAGGSTATTTTTTGKKKQVSSSSLEYSLPYNQIRARKLPTHARITPAKGKKDILVPLQYYPTLGCVLEYHRRRYVFDTSTKSWMKVRCRTNMPTSFFSRWNGFTSPYQVYAARLRFGRNEFDVKQPTFTELYKAQLLSPFTVFQLFCVVLWMLDEYWQYSVFTLFMILTFEATVVFSRIKSLAALKGMGSRARSLYVYRMGHWLKIDSDALLPGDIFSLTRHRPHRIKSGAATSSTKAAPGATGKVVDDEGDIVPADLLLLKGFTVVNESSLTGESVPQMKEGLPRDEIENKQDNELLQMKGKDKNHVLYAGTKLLQCKGAHEATEEEEKEQQCVIEPIDSEDEDDEEEEKDNVSPDEEEDEDASLSGGGFNIPNPPDNGCICFVLRTGFSSAQGKLVRMIEGSQEKVKGHERETGLLLLLLFCFAIASSGYVLHKGMMDDNRSKYELLLHCILIITSVIPPELPMQMALAVNSSLMTLMRMQVFCTEPYRVPIAGKLDCCLFDKTGTLTTDELVAVGVCQNLSTTMSLSSKKKKTTDSSPTAAAGSRRKGKRDTTATTSGTGGGRTSSSGSSNHLIPMTQIQNEAGLVLAGCHSLVLVDDETAGDPLEAASLSAMRWRVTSPHGYVRPCPATEKRSAGKSIKIDGTGGSGGGITSLEVLARHHFSSKLQRMSCVVRDRTSGGNGGRSYGVAKGSPEAIGNLLNDKPSGYDEKSRALAKEGYRVIALAYKPLGTDEVTDAIATRAECEKHLYFAGFIAFTCRVRKDTKDVLARLFEGGMSVAMVTGDAILTACHVAKEVGIVEPDPDMIAKDELRKLIQQRRGEERKTILLLEQGDGASGLFWQSYEDESKVATYDSADVAELSKRYDLATTGKSLAAAFELDEGTKKVLQHIKIFARMTPDAKETVIECLHSVGLLCLMCGDGANDVGALKQADVGVALLSGFGDVNVDKGEDGNDKKKLGTTTTTTPGGTGAGAGETAMITNDELERVRAMPVRLIKEKIRGVGVEPDDYPDLVEKEDLVKLYRIKASEMAVRKHDMKNKIDKAKMTKAEMQAKAKADMVLKQQRMMERAAELEAQGVSFATFKAMKEFMGDEWKENAKKKKELQKQHTVEGSAAAMIAQMEDLETGDLPMVKLGDASIAAPFTSKMPSIRSCVDIIRQGRCTLVTSMQMYQILALNCLISAYSLSVLYLDGVKYGDTQMTAMGMLGSVSYMSVSRSKPLNKLSSVQPLTSIFHPSLFISLLGQFAVHLTTMILAVRKAKEYLPEDHAVDLDGEFKPSIFNSVVFLVSNVQQVTVFVVNLQGRPFMTGLTENRPLLWSLLATFILTFMFASESVPSLNKYFQLVPFPSEEFRDFILKILLADVLGAFVFDRMMKFMFCPQILFASMKGTTVKDVMGLARTIGLIFALMYMLLGNEETWEELLEQEGRLDELGMANATVDVLDNATAEAISGGEGAASTVVEMTDPSQLASEL